MRSTLSLIVLSIIVYLSHASVAHNVHSSVAFSSSNVERTHHPIRRLKSLKKKTRASSMQQDVPFSMSSLTELRGGSVTTLLPFQIPFPAMKVLTQVALTGFNILCWYLPMRNKDFTSNAELLALANCFAGGIFIMLSMGHLIPEAIATFQEHLPSHDTEKSTKLALTYTIAGFMAMLFIGKVAFDSPEEEGEGPTSQVEVAPKTFALPKPNAAIMLCFAMAFHSFFEAMALGIAADQPTAFLMASSVALHQPAESIALLVSFLKQYERGVMSISQVLGWLIAFSCVGIFGVSTGCLIAGGNTQLEAIVVSVTAGTFLYAAASEVASEEFDGVGQKVKALRFLAMLGGIGIINLVAG